MKQVIDLRPACHRKEERIRAHVILCWLALLLARIAENACAATWHKLRRQLDRIAVGTFTGPAAIFRQRTEITNVQQDILTRLGIDPHLISYGTEHDDLDPFWPKGSRSSSLRTGGRHRPDVRVFR